jgi:hypothetical protein
MLLLDDPRYKRFATLYAFDLVAFASEVLNMTPTFQQVELLKSVELAGSRVSVRSGHGSGKSRSIGVISLWHLLCYPLSNTMLTAPKIEQVRNVSWKEITDLVQAIKSGGNPWIADYVVVEAERVYVKGYKAQWFVFAKTAPRGSPENLAGMHRDWYLIISDEASGIPDANYSVMTGALTDSRNRMLLLSQPTRPSGFFYDTHNKLSKQFGGVWDAIRMDSRRSPLVSMNFVREKKAEYTDEEYTIKVLGEFPESREGNLMGRRQAENTLKTQPIEDGEYFGYIVSVDVGAGEYRDKSVIVVAKVTGRGDYGLEARRVQVVDVPLFSNTRNLQDLSGQVFEVASRLENATVLVDFGGMGVAVCQALETMGLPDVKRVKWGNTCFSQRNRERFFNLRAQAMVSASLAAKDGRLGIIDGHWTKDLLDQMTRVPYHFDEKARYTIERKEEMKKQGIPSPDIWDAICFLFLEDAHYNLCENIGAHSFEPQTGAISKARDVFSDLLNDL